MLADLLVMCASGHLRGEQLYMLDFAMERTRIICFESYSQIETHAITSSDFTLRCKLTATLV
jgi:hypothetical protein